MDENERLKALRDLVVLDSEPEPFFDSIAKLASEACGAPIAMLSLVDEQRLWFKANVGMPGLNSSPRESAFCSLAIEGDEVLVVSDASADSRFSNHPLVAEPSGIRFYAGAPITAGGANVGALCVLDRQPRSLGAAQKATLASLAAIASQGLAMRRDLIAKSLSARGEFESRLARSEAMHRSLLEGQSEMVCLCSADGRIAYASPAFARHCGLPPEQMAGMDFFSCVAQPDRAESRRQAAAALESGSPSKSESRMPSADGRELWVAWTHSALAGAAGESLLHSVGRDVTARRSAESALLASRGMLERTGRLAGVGGWEVDLASGKLTWTEQTRIIHEAPEGFAPTLEAAVEFYPAAARSELESAVAEALACGTPWDLELPMVTASGRRIWARSVGEAELADGKPVRLVGALADITARKELALRVESAERFVRQITDSLPIGLAYAGPDLRFSFANLEHCRRFGLPRDEVLGRTREELLGGALDDGTKAKLIDALAGREQLFESRATVDGRQRLFETRLVPDRASDGSVQGIYGATTDITERSANEMAMRELTAILENTPDFVIQTDRRGAITYMNPAARAFCGIAPDESVIGRDSAEFNNAETNELLAREAIPAVNARGLWTGEARLTRRGGGSATVSHMIIGHRGSDGRIDRYSAIMRDISEASAARQDLLAQTETLRAVLEAIPAAIAVAGADGRVRLVNQAYERWTGVPRAEAVGAPLAEAFGPPDDSSRRWIDLALAGESGSYERGIGGRHMAGAYYPLLSASGDPDGFVAVAQDITEHKREEVRLLQLAQRDPLTGLLNRGGFDEAARRLIAEGQGPSLALLCVDLDRFKPVNDEHGHAAGDLVLREFARRMERLVRPSDAVARVGGDEFAMLLPGMDRSAAAALASKVVAAASEPFFADGKELRIGASVGAAFGADGEGGWHELLVRADAKLYEAKAAGRGRSAGA